MKLLMENWRKYLKLDEDVVDIASRRGMKEFVFDESQLQQLNSSIAHVIEAAKKELGAEGSTPTYNPEQLDKIELTEPLKMVAEAEEEDEEDEHGATSFQLQQATPEQIALRKKYYGPQGELAKRGPKSVRDLERGLGQMSAEEFEETGYVIKVPEEVLQDFDQLVASARQTAGLYEEARDWYHDIRALLDRETENDQDAALLGLMIATYSPRAKFALNLTEAVFMYKAIQEDALQDPEYLKQYLETFPGSEKREPGSFRGFTEAHKVPNFALNLIAPNLSGKKLESGEVIYDNLYEWNSTIDTWMIDAFYPSLRKASTAKEWAAIKGKLMSNVVSYRYMTRLVAQEAKKLNILPHELQALIWVASQVRQTGEASLGVTTQFAFDQIRDAIRDVAEINNDLKALKTLSEQDWLGTILSQIDNEGFEEAAKIAVEKGAGVRSITSRGKKGEMFDYFPAPQKVDKPAGPKSPKGPPKEKEIKSYATPEYQDLKTHYVMNNVIQMPTGKFNNLYDSIMLYLNPEFSTDKAVEHILGRFDPEARSTREYFKEGLIRMSIRRK